LDILVQERRNEQAAVTFLHRVLAAAGGPPRVIVTDKLASYVPAVKRVLPTTEHRRHKRLNNRAENSHLPVRKRERVLQRFKAAEHAQTFLEPFSAICNHFRPRRHRLSAHHSREIMRDRFWMWQEVVGTRRP
jgi:putative transposase